MANSDSDGLSDKTNGILGLGPNQKNKFIICWKKL